MALMEMSSSAVGDRAAAAGPCTLEVCDPMYADVAVCSYAYILFAHGNPMVALALVALVALGDQWAACSLLVVCLFCQKLLSCPASCGGMRLRCEMVLPEHRQIRSHSSQQLRSQNLRNVTFLPLYLLVLCLTLLVFSKFDKVSNKFSCQFNSNYQYVQLLTIKRINAKGKDFFLLLDCIGCVCVFYN